MAVKTKFGVKNAVGAEPTGGIYTGDDPPKGAYKGILKMLTLKNNKNNDPMLNGLVEFRADKGDKKNTKYNGFGLWFNLNITDQGKGHVNQFLNSLSDGSEIGMRKIQNSFWNEGCLTEKRLGPNVGDSAGNVLRIGPLKVGSPEGGLPISVLIRIGKDKRKGHEGEEQVLVARWLVPKDLEDEEEEDEYEDEEVDDEDTDERSDGDGDDSEDNGEAEDSDEAYEDEADSDDEPEDDEGDEPEEGEDEDEDAEDESEDEPDVEGEDEDEEPAPPPTKRPVKKAAPKKKLF